MTALQARSDVLWEKLRADGVPNIAIGDLGNESPGFQFFVNLHVRFSLLILI